MTTPGPIADALGDEIVMGNTYGYATVSSGRTRVVTGTAVSLTKTGRVSLTVTGLKVYLYGKPSRAYGDTAEKVSVNSCILFPVRP